MGNYNCVCVCCGENNSEMEDDDSTDESPKDDSTAESPKDDSTAETAKDDSSPQKTNPDEEKTWTFDPPFSPSDVRDTKSAPKDSDEPTQH